MWSLDNQRAFERAERDYLTPPDDEEPLCEECGSEAEYYIDDRFLCEECIEIYRFIPANNEACSICEKPIEEGFSLQGDVYCEDCFKTHMGL